MADDKDALKAIETDVVPVLEKIEANTRTRAYKRRTGQNQANAAVSTAEPASSWIPAKMDRDKPTILAKRERVAKAELKTAIERKKAARAENGQFKSKSQEALKESKQKVAESAAQKTLLSRVGGLAGRVIGGKKGELGDAAGAAGAGVYYSAFREITDAIGDLRENDSGIVGFLKKKYNEKGASKAQEAQRKNAEREAQEAERKAASSAKNARKAAAGGAAVSAAADGGGDGITDILLGYLFGKNSKIKNILGKSKIGKFLGVGVEAAGGVAAGAAGGGLLSKAWGAARGGLGRAGGAIARSAPWLAGGAAAGAAGYGVGTLLNKGMGKLSGLVTGGKYEGDGWLGEAVYDLQESIVELITGVKKNTDVLEEGVHLASLNGEGALQGAVKSEEVRATSFGERLGDVGDKIFSSDKDFEKSRQRAAKVPESVGKGWEQNKGTIIGAAEATGADPAMMASIAAIESGFDPKVKARTSSAGGLYQFTDSTWKDMVKKYGSKYGIDEKTSKYDAKANALMGGEFLKRNSEYLKNEVGIEPNSTDLYMAHFLGAGGAGKFLKGMKKDPNAVAANIVGDDAARANRSIFYKSDGTARTTKEVYDLMGQKMTNANKFGADAKYIVAQKNTAEAAPSEIAQANEKKSEVAQIQSKQQAQPVSLQKESAQYSGALQDGSSSMNGVEGKLDKLIAINEEMKNSASKKEGEKYVENSPNIPMEYDDPILTLMAHDRI
jgi:hypothetical protein